MTAVGDYPFVGAAPVTWVPHTNLGTLSSGTTNIPNFMRVIHGAIAVSTVAAVLAPLPAMAVRQKSGEADNFSALADDATSPPNNIVDDRYSYSSSFESNSSIFENTGVLYKLQGGAITMRQHRTQKKSNTTSDPTSLSKSMFSTWASTPWRRSASTVGPHRIPFEIEHLTADALPLHSDPLLKALENVHSASLSKDALTFASSLRDVAWKPNVWADEGEVVFEWIDAEHHAVASIEGDGHLGYTLLIDGQFRSGKDSDALVTHLPDDLKEYLAKSA